MVGKSSALHLPAAYARKMRELSSYRWWKPLVAVLLALVFYLVFGMLVELAYYVILAAQSAASGTEAVSVSQLIANAAAAGASGNTSAYLSFDVTNPLALAHAFLSLAVAIPAIGLACKIMKIGGLRGLSSIEGGLRWKRIAVLLPWALLVAFGVIAIELGISVLTGEDLGEFRFAPAAIIVVLICCPLQCAAEEYMFRGFLMQTLGSWIPVVVIPVVLQALLFTILHGYNLLGLISICLMGLIAGYLALKTGGLEAGICMHTANNVSATLLGICFASAQTTAEVSAVSLVIDIALNVGFLVVMYWVSKRKGYLLDDEPAEQAKPRSELSGRPDKAVKAS